jgi:hypothetical protein
MVTQINRSPQVLSALDRTKTTDHYAIHTVCAVLQASGQCVKDFNVHHSSIQRAGQHHRQERFAHLESAFRSAKPLTIHWTVN